MTNDFISGIIALIKCALFKEAVSLPENFDWNTAYTLACEHQIAALLYYGIRTSKCNVPEKLLQLFRQSAIRSAIMDEIQMREVNRIQQTFEEHQIDFVTLKGCELKGLYPDRAIRVMGDIDILIRTEQYDRILPIMESLGYDQGVESNHEYVWHKSGALTVELHKRLIPSYNKDYYSYFGDGWRLAHPIEYGCPKYRLRKDDQFIYLFTHFAKHYRDGGVGIRHLIDLWVYQNAHPDMNSQYIRQELTKLDLYLFYNNINNTLNVWFNDYTPDNLTNFITYHIFDSGSYGTSEAKSVAALVKLGKWKDSAKRKKLMSVTRIVLLPFQQMTIHYPILKKLPAFLPLYWLIRIFDIILFQKNKLAKLKNKIKHVTPAAIDQYQQELIYVGLNFNFKG